MQRSTTPQGGQWLGALLGLLLFVSIPVHAEDVPVPAIIQVPLLLKILTFDRNFDQRVGSVLRIGVVYVDDVPASRQAKDDISTALNGFADKTIKKLPISYVLLRYSTEQSFEDAAKNHGVNVLYVTPGNAKFLAGLLRVSRKHRMTTVTGLPEYVKEGVTVGFDLTSDNKTKILINLNSARLEGVAFDANLLRLSTVLQR